MFFIFGVIFIVVGMVMLVMFLIAAKRPKIDAQILRITKEYPPQAASGMPRRKFPYAVVDYYYDNIKYEQKIILKSKSKVGDSVRMTVKPSNPTKPTQYHPTGEILAILAVTGIGVAIIIFCVVAMDVLG